MENKKTRLVTIDYDEYLELLHYKDILDGSNKCVEFRQNITSYTTIQQMFSDKLFDHLAQGVMVGKIEIFRSNYENR